MEVLPPLKSVSFGLCSVVVIELGNVEETPRTFLKQRRSKIEFPAELSFHFLTTERR